MNVKMEDGTPVKTLADAHTCLLSAMAAYEEAKGKADHMRQCETDALNKLNMAQRTFDNAVNAEKAGAPYSSVWGTPANKGLSK